MFPCVKQVPVEAVLFRLETEGNLTRDLFHARAIL